MLIENVKITELFGKKVAEYQVLDENFWIYDKLYNVPSEVQNSEIPLHSYVRGSKWRASLVKQARETFIQENGSLLSRCNILLLDFETELLNLEETQAHVYVGGVLKLYAEESEESIFMDSVYRTVKMNEDELNSDWLWCSKLYTEGVKPIIEGMKNFIDGYIDGEYILFITPTWV